MPDDVTPAPSGAQAAERGIRRLKRQIKSLCLEIKAIHSKGFAALSSSVERNVFRGMMVSVGDVHKQLIDKWDETIEFCELNRCDPAFPSPEEENYFREVKTLYYEIQGFNVQLEAKQKPTRSSTVHDMTLGDQTLNAVHVNGHKAILPKIPIKIFTGDVTRWPSFKQLFTSLIKDDPSLSDAERFHYLTSYLDGPALDSVRHITAVGENFEQAWAALLKVYDDPRQLARIYLDRFLSYRSPSGSPTVSSLQAYLSSVAESISSIRNLPIPHLSEYLLCELALRSLDPATRELFETTMVDTTFPSFSDLQKFVQQRCQVLMHSQNVSLHPSAAAASGSDHAKTSSPKLFKTPNKFTPKPNRPALMAHGQEPAPPARATSAPEPASPASSTSSACFICRANHGPKGMRSCPQFVSSTPAQRLGLLRRFTGCRNCLRGCHRTRECASPSSCRSCGKRHHTDLHLPETADAPFPAGEGATAAPQSANKTSPPGFAGASTHDSAGVLLGTVIAGIQDARGKSQKFRGVLDPGSMFSFVTEQAARALRMSARPFRGVISGVSDSPLQGVKGQVPLVFKTPANSSPLQTDAVIVPTITPPLPLEALQSSMWADYQSYQLSDPEFDRPGPVSFLIGADLFPEVAIGAPITIHEDGPRLLPTIFGYSVIGRYFNEPLRTSGISLLTQGSLQSLMERFWLLEEPGLPESSNSDEERCEQHFLATHRRDESGRYVVSLPFRSAPPDLVPRTSRVLSCLYSLESKFNKNEALRREYVAQLEEYKTLGHMRLATEPPRYLIPHHSVSKQEGDKVKIRVVFDASFPTPNGSLNQHLLPGPKLQADMGQILLRFRRHTFVLRCDIVKMFRQIWLEPRDRCYQQIAWRTSPAEPVQFYELTTVSFGLTSSPFLAQRVLRQHAINYKDEYPEASHVLIHGSYVDDLVAGSNDLEHLRRIKSELIALLALGGFELGKWNANHPSLLEPCDVPAEAVHFDFEDAPATKILGMKWSPGSDSFSYDVSAPPPLYTKRAILSTIARLYDPLGYLAPLVFYAKCIQQHTWQLPKLGWDDVVPEDVQESWRRFIQELPAVEEIVIPRAFPRSDHPYALVCFSDASSRGYCASVYLRTSFGSSARLTLLKAKTKVAPIKPVTIPRLELCGALLLTKVLQSLEAFSSDLDVQQTFCFTDSTTVLAWLHTPPQLLQTFVSNRVQLILSGTKLEWWHHIRGIENPADVGSRGISPAALKDHHLWWHGPEWCHRPITDWPASQEVPTTEVPEVKVPRLSLISIKGDSFLLDYAKRFSSYPRFVRLVAYLRRFIFNARIPKTQKSHRRSGPVLSPEFREADHHFVKLLQHSYYPEVYTKAHNDLKLELRRLNVFIDAEGLIRVGGRLRNAPVDYEQKHPILLPARSYYSNLIVEHYHQQNHHIGPAALLAAVHQRFWIPNARNLVKRIRHHCAICLRFSRSSVVPFMGPLPRSRFAAVRPFLITGVDFAGPFVYKTSALRKAPTGKAYLCLFICMSSRALHLEIATSLSVEGFLDAFDRFIARRGLPSEMLSDCGTNFRGTDRYLRELADCFKSEEIQSGLVKHTAHLNLTWNFNPPSSPHFGGGWEVSVRMVKDLIFKTFGNHSYTLPELGTAFTKIEGILNSRPLQALSTSPDDLEPLTPGHFLIGQPIGALPEPDLLGIPEDRLSRWQLVRARIQFFWSRWRDEYLHSLQLRQKWDREAPNLRVGDLVLIRDQDASPTQWPMGRIQEVHPGEDGVVRVVTLKTSRGVYRRPAVKMVPLPLQDIHQ